MHCVRTTVLMAILVASAPAAPTSQQLAFFESKVRPILAEHCFECHSSKAKRLEAGIETRFAARNAARR